MNNLNHHHSHNCFALSLTLGARLSVRITNAIIRSLKVNDFDYEFAVDLMKREFPTFRVPSKNDWIFAETTLQIHADNNIYSISILNESYPKSLRMINDPPPVLFLRGNINILKDIPGVSVVGTRKVTKNGGEIARRISSFLAESGWVVVSGLAIGADACAHRGAIPFYAKTIAVLAHGLDKASPKVNSALADDILLNGGAWVSEHPWGAAAQKEFFVLRNRIQIGLSAGSVIIEGDINSGTSTQVEYCIDSNRKLFAIIPQSAENPLMLFSDGPIYFVNHKGAYPIKSKDDYSTMLELLKIKKNEILLSEDKC